MYKVLWQYTLRNGDTESGWCKFPSVERAQMYCHNVKTFTSYRNLVMILQFGSEE